MNGKPNSKATAFKPSLSAVKLLTLYLLYRDNNHNNYFHKTSPLLTPTQTINIASQRPSQYNASEKKKALDVVDADAPAPISGQLAAADGRN